MEEDFASRHAAIENRIQAACDRAGRNRGEVTLVGVSKTFPPEVVAEAIRDGVTVLGENRVQEALAKAPLCPSAEWHLIGPLQKNKVRHALSLFTTIHAVDALDTLDALARVQRESGARPDVLLEVNVAEEASKHGFTAASVREAVRAALEGGEVRLVGLMTIPPWTPDPESSRPHLRAGRARRVALGRAPPGSLPPLSRGMSGDSEVAIEEGATFVRVGTALFGRRNASAWKPERSADSDSYFYQP